MNCKEETYMNKFKSILALMIAMVIMCVSAASTYADTSTQVENDLEIYRKFHRLSEDSGDYRSTFILDPELGVGAFPLDCDLDSAQDMIIATDEVCQFYIDVTDKKVLITDERIAELYLKLEKAAEKIIIKNNELEYIIDLCSAEKNDDGYYSEELWDSFQSKLAKAIEVYNKGENTIEVSHAYWDLLFAYNDLCVVSPVSGDVDCDGKLTVMDATVVQRSIAQLCDLNSAQLTVLNEYKSEKVTVLHATNIQRYLAQLDEKYESYHLVRLLQNTHRMCLFYNDIFSTYRYLTWQGRW